MTSLSDMSLSWLITDLKMNNKLVSIYPCLTYNVEQVIRTRLIEDALLEKEGTIDKEEALELELLDNDHWHWTATKVCSDLEDSESTSEITAEQLPSK
jgi:hypothetical protein